MKGGALILHHHINANIKNCTFVQNSAFHGAAVYAFMNVTLQVNLCTFTQNNGKGRSICVPDSIEEVVPAGGTFVMHEHSQLHVLKSVFVNNTSEEGTGTITLYRNISAVVEWCRFHGNVANWGGALFAMSHVNVYITEAIFRKNVAALIGGALDGGPNVNLYVNATEFSDNYARQGGAVNIQKESSVQLVDCTFTGQKSSTFGGALVLYRNASGNISNCRFNDNTADLQGGGDLYILLIEM